jgi:type III secretion protein D
VLAQRAQATLHAAGMSTVTVSVAAGQNQPLVEGYLDTHAQRTRAEALLAEIGLRPRFSVWINESLAQAVQDVYRVHGISAQVQPLGPGQVRVRTALADVAPLATVEQTVRRDVQGLKRLETQNAPPPGVPSPIPDVHDAGKRVASIVAGDEPYVATQDGTRYFIGALLPTGHRILAINDGRVELEREGQNTALAF